LTFFYVKREIDSIPTEKNFDVKRETDSISIEKNFDALLRKEGDRFYSYREEF